MKLTLLSPFEINDLILPDKHAGQYWVRGKNAADKMVNIVAVEASRPAESDTAAEWILKSNRRFQIVDHKGQVLPAVVIRPLEMYRVKSADGSLRYVIYTEPLSEDRKHYIGFELTNDRAKLTIGREDCNITYANNFVSSKHAEIAFSNDSIVVRDLGSVNKTYVNGKAIHQEVLKTGDVIYILGFQIIVVNRLIFLNNPDGNVKISSNNLREYRSERVSKFLPDYDYDDEFEDAPEDFYYRAPRFKYGVEEYELKIDPPPPNRVADEMPTIMMIGPSLTMGTASLATGIFAVINAVGRGDISSAIPSIIMSVSMLFATLLWPVLIKTYQRKMNERREAKRQSAYKEYLRQIEQRIVDETARQEKVLRDNDVSTAAYVSRILAHQPQIWERTPKHTDFLTLRLGYGSLPLKAKIQFTERKFSVEEDNLVDEMYLVAEKKRWLKDVPICLPLAERFVSGIYADRSQLIPYAKKLILQTVALHSYDEVKLVLLYNESDEDDLSFIRWLPHTMNNEKTTRYIATNIDEAKELSASLDVIIEYRKTVDINKLADETPYFLIICLDKELASKTDCVRRVLEHKDNLNFTVLSLFEQLKDLPKECTAVVELNSHVTGNMTLIGDVSDPPIPFFIDSPQQIDIQRVTRVLANTVVDISGSHFMLPKKYTFFEMYDIGMIEHINLLENWSISDPTISLSAAVGIDKYGEVFRLDLHERAHGPHGLVAGMTGSGKSEFIITYILSMAVTFHPEDVSFILIDYKGGGMAKAFENIPHTAGVITNLDGNEITRSLASLRSELHRRERIFRDVSREHSVSNIDIYKYQKLYREKKVSEPLPHLLIISDEFAELKKEQPEFMTELTSTARVGRSLGVHLILATQKPGGVVDDQIRSNSRFRVCLKVQDRGDSLEMLGRAEAANLVDTGRFYLQVGNNELFELGQSAWAGAPYYPSSKVIKELDDAVSVINRSGRVIAEANIDRFALIKDPPKQLDVITDYISKVAQEEHICQWKMWLDPIPAKIFVDELVEKYAADAKTEPFVMNPVIGEYDDPSNQLQGILRVPISKEGNAIVYGSSGNGKAMFIEAMCYSILKEHTPQEVNLYILDFGAETLTAFAKAPHVGDVILSHETEKVNNLFKLMMGKLDTRKKILSQFGGDLTHYNLQASNPEPNLIVFINNFAAFTELYEERTADINFLTREGIKYGIYFVLTCTGINNVRFSLLQNFKMLYCLQLNNPDDYVSVVGKTGGLAPEKIKGRGLVRLDQSDLVEFQVARVTDEVSPYNFIRDFSHNLAEQYSGTSAINVPVLPSEVSEAFLSSHKHESIRRIPVGVEKDSLEIAYYDFTDASVNLVLSVNEEWRQFTEALSLFIARQYGVRTMLFSPSGTPPLQSANDNLQRFSNMAESVAAAHEIYDMVLTRNNEYKDKLANGNTLPSFDPVFVVIQSMSTLKALLDRYVPDDGESSEAADDTPINRLQVAMEKCNSAYNVFFIVAENFHSLTPFTVENWYREHINGNNGLWIGGGINSQYRLNISRKPWDFDSEIETPFGFVVNKATATQVKFLQ